MVEIGKKISATIEKLVFGGKGLIRHQGWVIFVEDVAAGEEVEVEITAKKKSYFEAKLLRILKKSPLRVTPPCPYYGTCGGCQLQHLDYDEQLRLKQEWLKESLQSIAKIPLDFPLAITPAKQKWGYRRKVILHGQKCGFYARDNTTIVPIKRCLLFSEKNFECMPHVKNNKLVVMRDEMHQFFYSSQDVLCREIEGLSVYYNTEVFVQNDPEQSLQIYLDILSEIQEKAILDLYCGVGIFALLAAKRGHTVLGVELSTKAIQFAKQSAQKNKLYQASFEAMPCEQISRLAVENYPVWIVNPPRTGLSPEVTQIVTQKKPNRLIYISCMPTTLARDVKVLYEHGYQIEEGRVYDMFSQTTHLETVVYLKSSK